MQAKDIPDVRMLTIVREEQQTRADNWDGGWPHAVLPWTHFWEVEERLPDIPPKVIRAKAAKLIKRGLMTGCTCGCRGDLEVTALGMERISA